MNEILVFSGSATIMIWGAAHIFPVKSVVAGFGEISEDNKKIITMEWMAEGVAMIFIGVLALLVTILGGPENPVSLMVIRATAVMLIILAGLTAATGAQTSILPIKICPVIKTACATVFVAGTVL
jgi:hypothetical protein